MSDRRAKTAACPHGRVFSAHVYTVGNPISESDALRWVARGAPSWAVYDDVETATVNFGDCTELHEGDQIPQGTLEFK